MANREHTRERRRRHNQRLERHNPIHFTHKTIVGQRDAAKVMRAAVWL